jgi:hypothetical protein
LAPRRKQEISGGTSGFPFSRDPDTFLRMPAEARVMRTWIQQKGLIPVFLLGFSLWFLWDGLVGYPRSNERWDAHERLKAKSGEWDQYCTARGWTTEPPHKRYERSELIGQYVCAAVAGAVGAFSLMYWLRARKMFIRSEAGAVITPSGKRVPYESITHADLGKWKSKGLATVFYSLDGAKGRFVLDDAKYEPTALDAILHDIRQYTDGRVKTDE